ncbi:MAG TPA: hypothetical protein VHN99_06555, partial [Deinococcales bacterium]|nr:hypothetical protein [Deinococcales bacterium]
VAFPAGAEHPTTVLGDSRDDWRFHFFDCPGGSCRLDLPADRVNYARAYAGRGGSFSTDRAAISGPSQSVALVLPDFLHLDSPASGAVVEPGAVLAWRGPDALTAAIVYGLGYRFEAYTSGKSVTLPDLGAVGLPWAKGASLMASVVALPRGSLDALTDADGGYPTWDANTQETVDFATAP